MRIRDIPVWGAALLSLLSGCDRSAPRSAASSPPAASSSLTAQSRPTHVDSFIPREVALERFRKGSTRVTQLEHAALSRDILVRDFVRALERRDTTTIRHLAVSRDEFAWLYYPTSKQGLPPYSLNPDLLWFLLVEQSNSGMIRAFNQLGGKHLSYAGYRCEGSSTTEGENTLWGPCLVHLVQTPGDTSEGRLFGLILERGGRYKFLSYANKL
jgi:hypothetical protein